MSMIKIPPPAKTPSHPVLPALTYNPVHNDAKETHPLSDAPVIHQDKNRHLNSQTNVNISPQRRTLSADTPVNPIGPKYRT